MNHEGRESGACAMIEERDDAMTGDADPIDVLNRLLGILYRSLPMYLRRMRPPVGRGQEKAWEAIVAAAADQEHYARRMAEAIQAAGGLIDPGQFPVSFTALHDVSLDFLLGRVIELAKRDVRCIEQCVSSLAAFPRARELAEEALGNARGHLEMLEELAAGGSRVLD
jgi:hypothetical protein